MLAFSLKKVAPKKKDLAKNKERVRGLRTHTAKNSSKIFRKNFLCMPARCYTAPKIIGK